MSIRALLRFANLSDIKKGVSNPRRALEAIRVVSADRTTNIEDTTTLDRERRRVLCELFGTEDVVFDELLAEVRSESIQYRISECEAMMENYPFELGGMRFGGETAYIVTRLINPRGICEIGVANGLSTFFLLKAVERTGNNPDVRAIDKPLFQSTVLEQRGKRGLRGVGGIIPDSKEAGWIAPISLKSKYGYQFYAGDFTEILPEVLEEIECMDLAVYDASKNRSDMERGINAVIEALEPNGVLIADDIDVNDSFESITARHTGDMKTIGGVGIFKKGHTGRVQQ